MDLAVPHYILAFLTAGAQYYQIKMMQARNEAKKTDEQRKEEAEKKAKKNPNDPPDMSDIGTMMQKQMLIIIPVMTLVIGFTFPAGLTLYWFTSTIFMIGQQYLVMRETGDESPAKDKTA